tara:strand:- start:331 stop:582 length:252 start_codon:yes stop_codon:yes gene_type:complete
MPITHTIHDTYHQAGWNDKRKLLPKGALVNAEPATNLPNDSDITHWIHPANNDVTTWGVDAEGLKWQSEGIGLGVNAEVLKID